MQLNSIDQLKALIDDAEVVLIGIGEEWTYSINDLLLNPEFLTDLDKMKNIDNPQYVLGNLQKKYYEKFHSEELETAYKSLYQLLNKKDYFLVSMNYDRYPLMAGFLPDKCVFPCGNLNLMQCNHNCQNSLMDAREEYEQFLKVFRGELDGFEISNKTCPFCGEKIVYNTVEANNYCEGGYLEQWDKYMKFLQKTVNKKLCLIELGVSMRYPEVIRNAFEKTAFYNHKANLIRIHQSMIDVPETIQERSYTKQAKSLGYFGNIFVS